MRPVPPPHTRCARASPSSGTRVRGEQSNLPVIGRGTTHSRALTGDYNVLVEDTLPTLPVTGLEMDATHPNFRPGGPEIPASNTVIVTQDTSGVTSSASSLVFSSAAPVSSEPITTTNSSGHTASQVISDHPSAAPHSTASVLTSASSSVPAITTSSYSETTMKSSHLSAVIGGAAGGGVALLSLVVIVTLCLQRRRRRLSRPTVNDAAIINDVAQYPISSPMAYIRKGSEAGIRIRNSNTDGAQSGLANYALDSQDTAVAATGPGQDDAPVLDLATASVMFRQLERFMRSVHGDNVQPESASDDDGDLDSLPQYRSVAEFRGPNLVE